MRSLAALVFVGMLLPKAAWASLGNSSNSARTSITTDILQFFGSLGGQLTCYSCNPPFCDKYDKQTCPSGYDYCLTAAATVLTSKFTLKTCTTKDVCDVSQSLPGFALVNVKCCQSYLCNGAESFTLSFLLMFVPLLVSILSY